MKLIADLHTHTVASGHAFSTLRENAAGARAAGLGYLGLSDHGPAMVPGLEEAYFHTMKVLPQEMDGVRILRSAEANILDDTGRLDLPDDIFERRMDYVIAGLHVPIFKQHDKGYATSAVLRAMENPWVRILAHPDDSRFPLVYEQVVAAAKRLHVALEVNNASFTPYAYRENGRENALQYLALCKQQQVWVVVSSDAHVFCDVGVVPHALELLREVDFPEELVVNVSEGRLKAFLAAKGNRASF